MCDDWQGIPSSYYSYSTGTQGLVFSRLIWYFLEATTLFVLQITFEFSKQTNKKSIYFFLIVIYILLTRIVQSWIVYSVFLIVKSLKKIKAKMLSNFVCTKIKYFFPFVHPDHQQILHFVYNNTVPLTSHKTIFYPSKYPKW